MDQEIAHKKEKSLDLVAVLGIKPISTQLIAKVEKLQLVLGTEA